MRKHLYLFALLFLVAACEKKRSVAYPFLNDSMNEMATINRAELMALQYQSIANGKQMSYGSGGTFAPLYEDRVEVAFLPSGVLLKIEIEIAYYSEYKPPSSEPEAKRIEACQKVCWRNIAALAQFLQCDPALITTEWSCFDLRVKGKISGQEAVSMIASGRQAEQAGADQPATAPELKSEGKDKPKPESKVAPR